jgi:IS5 family transposase
LGGLRLRVDTTVVETNIHYPTDATLLGDGIRVLTRAMRRLGERVRQRTRSVGRRLFEIAQRSRTAGHRANPKVREHSKARMKALYQDLMGMARAVLRQAEGVLAGACGRTPAAAPLSTTIDLLKRVVAQTRARVLRGNTRSTARRSVCSSRTPRSSARAS